MGADLALVLALDGSASVTFDEFGLMAGGIAAALRDEAVAAGLVSGPAKRSLLALLLWSGTGAHEVLVGWTPVESQVQVEGFADAVENAPRVVRAGQTAIGEALLAAGALLDGAPEQARRRVVDVIGDGRSNEGIDPAPVRDALVAAGVTINGLCVLHEEPDLLDSYTRTVIGGPGAFALPCPDYPAFAEAMRRKLVAEIEDKPIA